MNVLALQLALRTENARKYPLVGTGYYGDKTLRAVQAFQRAHGIRSSGIVGQQTWHALLGNIPANSGPSVPAFGIQPGECSAQKMGQLYYRIERIYPYYTGGYPGFGTCYTAGRQAMVQDFQRRAGINPSGIVGPKTWAALHKIVSASAGWGC